MEVESGVVVVVAVEVDVVVVDVSSVVFGIISGTGVRGRSGEITAYSSGRMMLKLLLLLLFMLLFFEGKFEFLVVIGPNKLKLIQYKIIIDLL